MTATAPRPLDEYDLEELVSEASRLRTDIAIQNRELDALKELKDMFDKAIIDALSNQGISSAGTKFATVTVTEKTIPVIDDWEAFYEYVEKNKAFYLLQRRAAVKACTELLGMEDLPFMHTISQPSLSLRKK